MEIKGKVRIGVLSFSGGQDSSTTLYHAKDLGYELTALSFVYGQTLSKEIQGAKKICELAGVKHKIFDIAAYKDLAWFSCLTHPELLPMPKEVKEGEVPFTYVPIRNLFFLVCCGAYLESDVLWKIEVEGVKPEDIERASIFISANYIDYSNYPDCRPEFYREAVRGLIAGSKMGSFYKIPIKVELPLIKMSKREITELGVRLGVPLHLTWTCYRGEKEACGECPSCKLRINGFKEAGYIDPIKYKITIDWTGCREIKF